MNTENLYSAFFFFLSVLVVRYTLVSGLAHVVLNKFLKQRLAHRKLQGFKLRPGQIAREIKYSLLTCLIFATVGTYFIYLKNHGMGKFYENVSDYGWPYLFFSAFVALAMNDIGFYFTHRWLHTPWMFRRFHKVHHDSKNPTPWTSYAFHPVESILTISVVYFLPWVMPVHMGMMIPTMSVAFFYNVYLHSGYKLEPDSWEHHPVMKWIMLSLEHNRHHEKVKGNFGLYFSGWDRLFGTYMDPSKDQKGDQPQSTEIAS